MPKHFVILLVEDNSDDEELTRRALRRIGPNLEIEVARDGLEAITRLLDEALPVPNLILLDLHLPKINGLEVLARIRAEERIANALVVVLTSSDEPEDVRASYCQHANSYIQKPVSLQEFSEVVLRLGIYWFQTNKDAS